MEDEKNSNKNVQYCQIEQKFINNYTLQTHIDVRVSSLHGCFENTILSQLYPTVFLA